MITIDLNNKADWQIFEEFKKIDLREDSVRFKNNPELVSRILLSYPFCRYQDDWVVYDRYESYGNKTFKIGNLELDYYRGWKGNREATNNRAIEIPLANWFCNKYPQNTIEIGDVSCHYERYNGHEILDPYGPFPQAIRKDVMDFDYRGKNVVSVSTWEHFSDASYNNNDREKPIAALRKIIDEACNYLITFDIGGDRYFEDWLMNQKIQYTFMVRDNFRGLINNWHQSDDRNTFYQPYLHWEYGLDYYGNAASIGIISNQNILYARSL